MHTSYNRSTAIVMDTVRLMSETAQPSDPALRDAVGRLTYLAIYLRRFDSIPSVPQEHWESLSDLLSAVPIQAPSLGEQSEPARWLQLASLAEFHGFSPLARLIIDGISATVPRDGEIAALCEAQRGRIARLNGDLSDAILHYKDAIRHSQGNTKGDAWTRAHCGLANVYADMGNFPAAEKCFRRALQHGQMTASVTRVYAWMGLAMVRRKRGDLADAMLSAWNAFDLTDEVSPLRADLLVALAECALELGDHSAARNGFGHALQRAMSTRIKVASVTGLILCDTLRIRELNDGNHADRSTLESLSKALRSSLLSSQSLIDAAPTQQKVFAMLACADAWTVLDSDSRSDLRRQLALWLESSRALIEQFGYHEYRFREEIVSARVANADSASAGGLASPSQGPTSSHTQAHHALHRLALLNVDKGSLVAHR